jgi:recombination protein RecA
MKIGVVFGSPETTTGGHALKYYASVRLDIRRIGPVKVGDEVVGNRTKIKVVKNKLAPPFQITEVDIRYGHGIDALGDLIDMAVAQGALEKRGAYFALEGESVAQGREAMRELLLREPALFAKLRERVLGSPATHAASNGNGASAAVAQAAAG